MKKACILCFAVAALLSALCIPVLADDPVPPEDGNVSYLFRIPENAEKACTEELSQAEALFAGAGIYKTDDLSLIEELQERHLIVQYEEDPVVTLCALSDSFENFEWRKTYDYRSLMLGYDYVKATGVTGAGVTVGLIDSGLWSDFQDYTEATVLEGVNLLVPEGHANRHDVSDTNGHGTFAAAVICALDIGLAPEVSLLPLKCFEGSSTYLSNIISAVDEAVQQGCDIINMSLGTYTNDSILRQAIQTAMDADILVIASAGNLKNDSTGHDAYMYPASQEGVISVGSVDNTKAVSARSSQNDLVSIVAPGIEVLGITTDGRYSNGSGTSFSAPVVTAAAALALSADPAMTAAECREFLLSTAEDLGAPGKDNSYGYGLLDPALLISEILGDTDCLSLSYWDGNYSLTSCAGPGTDVRFLSVFNSDGRMLSIGVPASGRVLLPKDASFVRLFSLDAESFAPHCEVRGFG